MFQKCYEIEYLDLSNFNLTNAINAEYMFSECYKLKDIKGINKFIKSRTININNIFHLCKSLEYLNYIKFDFSNVIKEKNSLGKEENSAVKKEINEINANIEEEEDIIHEYLEEINKGYLKSEKKEYFLWNLIYNPNRNDEYKEVKDENINGFKLRIF